MNEMSWRDRVLAEEALLKRLESEISDAAKRRAAALNEGVAELGSVYAVAKDLGRSWNAVDKAIKKHGA